MSGRHFSNRAELQAAIASGELGGRAMHLLVLHDDGCKPKACTCEPEFVLEELTVETYTAGQAAEAKWVAGQTQTLGKDGAS